MAKMISLNQIDSDVVEALLNDAFGADRKQRTAYRLRDGTQEIAELSFALVDGGNLLGTIQCWPVALDTVPMVLVGPVAVAPNAQGKGYGKLLMQAMLDAAEAQGFDALMMIGDPDYYGRFFGFSSGVTGAWIMPGPVERHRLLARIKGDTQRFCVAGRVVPNPAFALNGACA